MKQFKGFILGALMTLILIAAIPSAADSVEVALNTVKIILNGQSVKADTIIYNGRTFVPLRVMSENFGKKVDWNGQTSTVTIGENPAPIGQLVDKAEFEAYLKDVAEQTHREIQDTQKQLIMDYVSKNPIGKIEKDTLTLRRADFDKKKKGLIAEWEKQTGQEWPTYQSNVLGSTGKILRTAGTNYDMHHLVELSYGGPNEWWNMHPAAYPNEHQGGIHRKDGPASKLYDEDE